MSQTLGEAARCCRMPGPTGVRVRHSVPVGFLLQTQLDMNRSSTAQPEGLQE